MEETLFYCKNRMAADGEIRFTTGVGNDIIEVHGAEQSVVIGEYTFTAHYAYMRGGRPTIVFTSKREVDELSSLFFAYKSNSEGFWRLLMGEAQYYKGHDYITSNFLAFELQILFNAIFATDPPSLPTIPDDLEYTFFSYVMPSLMDAFIARNSYRVGRRIVEEPIFQIIQKINLYKHDESPPRNLYGGPALRSVTPETFFTRYSPLKNYYRYLISPQNEAQRGVIALANSPPNSPAAGNGTPPPHRRASSSPKAYLDPANWVYRRAPPATPQEAEIEDWLREEIVAAGELENIDTTIGFGVIGRVASHVFRPVDGVLTPVLVTKLQYPRSQRNLTQGIESFDMHVYSTQYTSIHTGNTYNFYIGFYIFRGDVYKHLVNIVPITAGVFENGCYTQIVNTDYYIYKPLDYYEQCNSVRGRVECSLDYAFIGHIFQGMWPLTEFPAPPELLVNAPRTNLGIAARNTGGTLMPAAVAPLRPRGAGVRGGIGGGKKTYRRKPKARRNTKSKKQKKRN